MSAHLSKKILERFRLRRLSPEELLTADEHLSACEGCRLKLAGAGELRGMTSALRADLARASAADEHLAYEQFAAYADGELRGTELSVVESHIASCALCDAEARELLDLRQTLHAPAPGFGGLSTIEADAVRPASSPERARRRGLREALAAFRGGRTLWSPQWAAVAAAVLLLAFLSVWWLASKSQRTPEVARHAPESAQPPQPTTTPAVPTPAASPTPDEIVNGNSQTSPTPGEVTPLLALEDGARRVTVEQGGVVRGLEELPRAYREPVRAALTTQSLPTPAALAEVRSGTGTLLGSTPSAGESFKLEGPAGIVARTDRPVFRWRPLAGAQSYTVKLYDADFNLLTASPPLNANVWRPLTPLARGHVYAWQVTAKRSGAEVVAPIAPAPEARFKILGRTEEAELARAERDFAGSHLTLGVLYTRAGLLAEAEAEFAALLRANPRSPVAQKLLRNVREMRRRR